MQLLILANLILTNCAVLASCTQLYSINLPNSLNFYLTEASCYTVYISQLYASCTPAYNYALIIYLSNRNEEEIEAMYIRRRFQGLSLEEQTKLQKKKRNKSVSRKGSGASKVSINTRNGRIRSVNPFGLQVNQYIKYNPSNTIDEY